MSRPYETRAPNENADLHDFPRRNAVGDDQAENEETERPEAHDIAARQKRREQDSPDGRERSARKAAGNDELNSTLCMPSRFAQVTQIENDHECDRRHDKKPTKKE